MRSYIEKVSSSDTDSWPSIVTVHVYSIHVLMRQLSQQNILKLTMENSDKVALEAPVKKISKAMQAAILLRKEFRQVVAGNGGECPRCRKEVTKLSDSSIMYHIRNKCTVFGTRKLPSTENKDTVVAHKAETKSPTHPLAEILNQEEHALVTSILGRRNPMDSR